MSHLEELETLRRQTKEICDEIAEGWGGSKEILEIFDRAVSLGGKSVVAQLLEAYPMKDLMGCMEEACKDKSCRLCVLSYGRKVLIAKAIQLGVMENDKWTRESIGKEIPHP